MSIVLPANEASDFVRRGLRRYAFGIVREALAGLPIWHLLDIGESPVKLQSVSSSSLDFVLSYHERDHPHWPPLPDHANRPVDGSARPISTHLGQLLTYRPARECGMPTLIRLALAKVFLTTSTETASPSGSALGTIGRR